MNELEKADRVIDDRDYKAADIEKKTGISRQTISNYRQGRVMLENATWSTVHALAEYHDTMRTYDAMDRGFNNFVSRLSLLLNDLYEDEKYMMTSDGGSEAIGDEKRTMNVVAELQTYIANNKDLALTLFQAYTQSLDD